MRYLLLTVLFFVATRSLSAGDPHVRDGRYVLTPLASHPDIVTPIGLEFDHKGRLLVIESHTHFAPKNYAGPKADRIRLVEDTDGDGKADRFRTFHEGTVHTMSLLRGPENWIYLATRKRIFRIKDTNNDDVADAEEEIARLDTAGNYPHNGLCGLCFDAAGNLYFGMGENLGEPYKLVGKDVTLTGGGEGGNLYRCRADGAGLEKFSTGVWNPFAICFDPQGRMFTVDNDPDSRPPCRLLQVVRTADYGFQFRFGRQGVHPLQSWNGELPGMLPMLGGTGEAPCDVLPFHGALWVTSWGDNRIERYTLTPAGPVLRAVQDVIIQGDQNFRPVDFAVSPDGTLYFTDWVDKNYTLHGKGRIWKLAAKDPALAAAAWPSLTPAEIQAHSAEKKLDLEMLKNPDATLRQFAISGLAQSAELSTVNFDQLTHPAQRLSLLQAHKWNEKLPDAERDALLGKALADTDADVCLFAVRWIADHDLTALRAKLDGVLKRTPMPASLFQAALAAMDWLDLIKGGGSSKKLRQRGRDQYLVDTLNAQTSPPALRALSLRLLPADNPYLSIERLRSFLKQPDAGLQREAVRALALRKKDDKLAVLAELAAQEDLATALRADAILGLADRAADYKELLTQLAAKGPPAVKAEALRSCLLYTSDAADE